jgi:hypothetical protein
LSACRRSSPRSRPLIKPVVAIFACAALLLIPSPADADWQAAPAPPGGVSSILVADLDSWLVEPASSPCCIPTFNVTDNGGASWTPVQIASFDIAFAVGVAPDGSFRVVAIEFGSGGVHQMQVFRITSTGGVEPLGPVISGVGGNSYSNLYAVADDGSTWVPFYSSTDNAFELTVVRSDGSAFTQALPENVAAERWRAMHTYFGVRLQLIVASLPGVPQDGPLFKLKDESGFVQAEAHPVEFVDGELWLSPSAGKASWDGGAHWTETFEFAEVVPRALGLGAPRYLISKGELAERYSPFLFRYAGLTWPGGTSPYFTVDVGSALVAPGTTTIYVQDLPLPQLPTEIGQLPDDARGLIARADLFRADAGLPPLTGDTLISRAAHNHSAYTAAHPDELAGLSAHNETPGKSGFTGYTPFERCVAVGTSCGGEVMYSPVTDPVGGWLATVYHRGLPGAPQSGIVGGGKVDGGWFVMDAGADQNFLIQPFGYPVGRWRGEEGFSGEVPDPIEVCQEGGQPISYPVGIAVTLFIPDRWGTVERIQVRRHGDSGVLGGCLLGGGYRSGGSFILDDPLVRGQTYDVSAEWSPGPDMLPGGGSIPGPNLSFSWSFHFDPDRGAERSKSSLCRSLALRTIKSVAKARRGKAGHYRLGIEEKVTLKQKATVRLRRARLNYWIAGDRHSIRLKLGKLRSRSIEVGTTSFLRFRLPRRVVDRVEPGEPAELQLAFIGRRKRGCTKPVHISRIRKVEIGWVRVRGSAAWVSGRGKLR